MRTTALTLVLDLFASTAWVARQPDTPARAGQAMGAKYEDLKWPSIIPELGADSPQISILRVDPKTQATEMLIRVDADPCVPCIGTVPTKPTQ